MANMSYCRFENTLENMKDCFNALSERDHNIHGTELDCLRRMISLCEKMVTEYEDSEYDNEEEEEE